ncbi:Conserved_hypothetical protein [Hexamita inflata]|uniref:Uncharacterized protein n=1 Tax=Hexamita inflata TaxID=28002 RepID=A0AA86V0R0_9EUKA|nr:Conserved hypothetical protein [Hexamita inflata]
MKYTNITNLFQVLVVYVNATQFNVKYVLRSHSKGQFKIKQNEDAVVENIEKLTGAKQAQFVGVQNKIKDLQNGVVKAQPINKQREIIDVKKWSNIQDIMVIPDLKKIDAAAGKKIERQPPPFALDE